MPTDMTFNKLAKQIAEYPDAVQWNRNAVEISFSRKEITQEQRGILLARIPEHQYDLVVQLQGIKPFDYPQVAALPFPPLGLNAQQQVALQLFCLNLARERSSPVQGMKEEEKRIIDTAIRTRFNVNLAPAADANIDAFINWLQTILYFRNKEQLIEGIRRHVLRQYGPSIAQEVMRNDHPTTVDEIAEASAQRRAALSGIKLTRQDLFELYFLRYVILELREGSKTDRILWQQVRESMRKRFTATNVMQYVREHVHWNAQRPLLQKRIIGKTPEQWNYQHILDAVRMVITADRKLFERYGDHQVLFLARDAIIFHEAYRKMHPEVDARIIYVSRKTLSLHRGLEAATDNEYFRTLQQELLEPAIAECGETDIEAVIAAVQRNMVRLLGDPQSQQFRQLTASLYDYLAPRIRSRKVVFFDSSSRTIPVLLAAFCRMMFPGREFKAYFAITPFTDPKAGAFIDQHDAYTTDFLMSEVRIDEANSSAVPYDPRVCMGKPIDRAQHFMTMLLLYRELG